MGIEETNNFSLVVQQKFAKIPRNFFGCVVFLVVETALSPQEAVNCMGIGSVDVYLFEEGELGPEFVTDESNDVFVALVFLVQKLIAGEGQDL